MSQKLRTTLGVLGGGAVLGVSTMVAVQSTSAEPPGVPSAAIVELRQYTLYPGQRDTLIELFDREFVETQEALGITVIGQFRDLDRPDYFVWLRGFPDMPSRAASLAAFYDGPVWRAHAHAANRTMIDSDDVLLLEPASPTTMLTPGPRPKATAAGDPGLVVATIYYPRPEAREFPAFFERSVRPRLATAGAVALAQYATSTQANNFTRLPVRGGEIAFVWFARFKTAGDYDRDRTALADDAAWPPVAAQLASQLARPTETLRLAPTSRSRVLGE